MSHPCRPSHPNRLMAPMAADIIGDILISIQGLCLQLPMEVNYVIHTPSMFTSAPQILVDHSHLLLLKHLGPCLHAKALEDW